MNVDLVALSIELTTKHGADHRERIERGLKQAWAAWTPEDGDFAEFARASYLPTEAERALMFARLERVFEQIDGHMNEISRELRWTTDVDVGPNIGIDSAMAGLDPSAHMTEDLFASKIAFWVLLNYPLTTLDERTREGVRWNRQKWAEARLSGRFSSRVPAKVQQAITKAASEADSYINGYYLYMHHVLDEKGERLFPKDLRLISHWNLRDELKANYALGEVGLRKQKVILRVMERIVTQTIPLAVIDDPRVDWDPFANTVTAAPASEIETLTSTRAGTPALDGKPEPNRRYQMLLAQFKAARAADAYYPVTPDAVKRSFERSQEMPEDRMRALFTAVLKAPEVTRVAALISTRLGRPLGPQDLWYSGFKAQTGKPESELDAITKKKYPDAAAFKRDMPRLLRGLSFTPARADYLASKIAVDSSRGAGHAMQAMRRGDLPHLRTRVEATGMSYKGYNIAIHEMGHNVEQVFSLYDVDHTLLAGVPNNAFTEALAFVFQARDLELLGLVKPTAEADRMRVLADFWSTWEIAGVALVDVDTWHWMYAHPKATPAELNAATVEIAEKYWKEFYAPVLGEASTPLLGIYSHMISYPLYLSNYPLGHLIAFQIEEHMMKSRSLGEEFERMSRIGSIVPDVWMQQATGAPVSADPLLTATRATLDALDTSKK